MVVVFIQLVAVSQSPDVGRSHCTIVTAGKVRSSRRSNAGNHRDDALRSDDRFVCPADLEREELLLEWERRTNLIVRPCLSRSVRRRLHRPSSLCMRGSPACARLSYRPGGKAINKRIRNLESGNGSSYVNVPSEAEGVAPGISLDGRSTHRPGYSKADGVVEVDGALFVAGGGANCRGRQGERTTSSDAEFLLQHRF